MSWVKLWELSKYPSDVLSPSISPTGNTYNPDKTLLSTQRKQKKAKEWNNKHPRTDMCMTYTSCLPQKEQLGTDCKIYKRRKSVGFVPYSIRHAWEELDWMNGCWTSGDCKAACCPPSPFPWIIHTRDSKLGFECCTLSQVRITRSSPKHALALEICRLQPQFLQAKCESTPSNIRSAS